MVQVKLGLEDAPYGSHSCVQTKISARQVHYIYQNMTQILHPPACAHCGDAVLDQVYQNEEGKWFCCTGCLGVYTMLQNQGWDHYYKLMELERSRAPSAKYASAYRDQVAAWEKAGAYTSWGVQKGDLYRILLRSAGISCSACGWLLEKALGEVKGVEKIRVDFIKGTMILEYKLGSLDVSALLLIAHRLGYAFYPIEKGGEKKIPSPYLPRLAVASAVFMNVMAFAFAEYFDVLDQMDVYWRRFFHVTSLIITLPVVTYSASPFYQRAWQGLRHRTLHMDLPISIGLIVAYGYSLWVVVHGGQYPFFDGVAGLCFFLLAGRWAVDRWERGLALEPHLPESLGTQGLWLSKSGAEFEWLTASDAKPGDRAMIAPGEIVPLDGILETDTSLFDTSLLTGESRPIKKNKGELIYSGYKILRHQIAIRVVSTEDQGRTQRLVDELRKLREASHRRQSKGEKIVPYFIAIVLIGSISGFFWHLSMGWEYALRISLSLLILTCSCALALATPLTVAAVYARSERRGMYLLRDRSLYIWSTIKAVVFDKTGTLSFSERLVNQWEWFIDDEVEKANLRVKVRSLTAQSHHPVSVSVEKFLNDPSSANLPLTHFKEWLHFGLEGRFEGDSESWILCKMYRNISEIPDSQIESLSPLLNSPSWEKWKENPPTMCILKGMNLVAAVWLAEEIRPAAKELVSIWKSRGWHTALFSGDDPLRVEPMGKELGFDKICGAMDPEGKQKGLLAIQKKYGPVLAIGDGFNDALLLGSADVSIAMGRPGVLLRDVDAYAVQGDLKALLWFDRLLFRVPKVRFAAYSLSVLYNSIAFILAWQGLIAPLVGAVLMPLSTMSLLLCVAIGTMVKDS